MSIYSWSCIECGISGRPGTVSCSRRGLAVVKGKARCCVCSRRAGWEGFEDCGCQTCFIRLDLPFPEHRLSVRDPFTRNDYLVDTASQGFATAMPWRLTAQPWRVNAGEETAMSRKAERIELFCFDDCLFRTPRRPKNWPYSSYLAMPQSLVEPVVPNAPSAAWLDAETAAAVNSSAQDSDCTTAVICTRRSYLKDRATQILEACGIPPLDEFFTMPETSFWSVVPPKGAKEAVAEVLSVDCNEVSMRLFPEKTQRSIFTLFCVCASIERVPSAKEVVVWLASAEQDAAELIGAAQRHIKSTVCITVRLGGKLGPHEPMDPLAFVRQSKEKQLVAQQGPRPSSRRVAAPTHSKHHDPFPADTLPRRARRHWYDYNYKSHETRWDNFVVKATQKAAGQSGVSAALVALDAPPTSFNIRIRPSVTPACLRDMGFNLPAEVLGEVAASARNTDEAVSFLLEMQGLEEEPGCPRGAVLDSPDFSADSWDWPSIVESAADDVDVPAFSNLAGADGPSPSGQDFTNDDDDDDDDGDNDNDDDDVEVDDGDGDDDEWMEIDQDMFEVLSVADSCSDSVTSTGDCMSETLCGSFSADDASQDDAKISRCSSYLDAARAPPGPRIPAFPHKAHSKSAFAPSGTRSTMSLRQIKPVDLSPLSTCVNDGAGFDAPFGSSKDDCDSNGDSGITDARLLRAGKRAVEMWHASHRRFRKEERRGRQWVDMWERLDGIPPQPIIPEVKTRKCSPGRLGISARRRERECKECFVAAVGRVIAQ